MDTASPRVTFHLFHLFEGLQHLLGTELQGTVCATWDTDQGYNDTALPALLWPPASHWCSSLRSIRHICTKTAQTFTLDNRQLKPAPPPRGWLSSQETAEGQTDGPWRSMNEGVAALQAAPTPEVQCSQQDLTLESQLWIPQDREVPSATLGSHPAPWH